MSELYPTPTRLALLRDAADGYVHRFGSVDTDRSGRVVIARIAELERAGWVKLDPPVADRWRFWRLTPAGRAVLDAHGGAS